MLVFHLKREGQAFTPCPFSITALTDVAVQSFKYHIFHLNQNQFSTDYFFEKLRAGKRAKRTLEVLDQ